MNNTVSTVERIRSRITEAEQICDVEDRMMEYRKVEITAIEPNIEQRLKER